MARNLRYACRLFWRNRFFSLVVILLLGIGIGANTLVFSLVNELLLKPLPVRDPDNLFLMEKNREKQVRPEVGFAYSDFHDIIQASGLYSAAVAEQELFTDGSLVPLAAGTGTRLVSTQIVSPNYFTELGVEALLGRVLTPADAMPSSSISVVLSCQFWKSQFGASRSVVGREIRLKGSPYLVVGVLPCEFHSLDIDRAPDVRLPVAAARLLLGHEIDLPDEVSTFRILVRLAPGIPPLHAADAVLAPLRAALERNLVSWNARQPNPLPAAKLQERIEFERTFRLGLEPARRGVSRLRDQFSRALSLLLGGVFLLLLAVCANIAGLLFARSDLRRRELGIRLAVGAGRGQLIRQLMTEHLLLAIPGAALGTLLAYAAAPALIGLLPPPRDYAQFQSAQLLEITPDHRILPFTIALTVFCVFAFGLLPAFRATRVSLAAEMKAATTRGGGSFAAIGPVALQVAFCVVLLAAAGLMLRTFWKLDHVDAGVDRAHVVEFTFDPKNAGYDAAQSGAFARELASRVGALPGVRSTAYASRGVMRGVGMKTTLSPVGVPIAKSTFLNTSFNSVTPSYFETLGIPLVAGRNLAISDQGRQPRPIIVNQAFADFFFPHQNPIGKIMSQGTEIVGVVATAKYRSMREQDPPTFYDVLDPGSASSALLLLYVRTYGAPSSMLNLVRDVHANLDPAVPLVEAFTLEQEIQTSLWQERLVALLASFFGVVSVLLAGIGLYGALTYSVAQRTHELGIRVAIGARVRHILSTVCSPVAMAVGCGLVTGGLAAVFLLRLTAGLLYEVRPSDPFSFGAAAAFVVVCAAAASAIPAWRALKIDPARALREE